MKQTIYITILLLLLLYNSLAVGKIPEQNAATEADSTSRSRFYTTQDSVVVFAGRYDTIAYSKEEFNAIVDNHPELYDGWFNNPDITYNARRYNDFGSEAGADRYYMLYAYFLKQQNGVEKYAEQRQKLVELFENISYIFSWLRGGGTYFGHQSYRIFGYVEYALYELTNTELSTYNITKQKELYIQALRQLIQDEKDLSLAIEPDEKMVWLQSLNKAVDDIERNITDIFYLRKAQEFQYSHYGYFWD